MELDPTYEPFKLAPFTELLHATRESSLLRVAALRRERWLEFLIEH
jgi:hypothetical protein